MLTPLQWDTLENRRKGARLSMFHKIHHGQTAIPAEEFLHPVKRHSRNLHNLAYQPASFNKDCHKYSFFPQTIRG